MTSAPAIVTDHPEAVALEAGWLCSVLQAGDSFYPTGSYAHSFGLEGLVADGAVRDRESFRAFLFSTALPILEHADLPIVAHAWSAFGSRRWELIGDLSVLASALRATTEARLACENIGRQRAELLARLQPGSVAVEYVDRAGKEGWPFAAGISAALEARTFGAPPAAALAGYTYSSLSALTAAAMKLIRLGQNGAQSVLTEALASAPRLVGAAQQVPITEIGWFNPWLDIASARHETADARMFIS